MPKTTDEAYDEYMEQAKKLLSSWQEAMQQYWQDPETLNQWFAAMNQVYNATTNPATHGNTYASSPFHPSTNHSDDGAAALRAELAELRKQYAQLQREHGSLQRRYDKLAKSDKASRKPAKSAKSTRAVRAASTKKPASKSKPKPKSKSGSKRTKR